MKTFWLELTFRDDEESKKTVYKLMTDWIGSLNQKPINDYPESTLEVRRCELVLGSNIMRIQLQEIGSFTKLLIESKKMSPKTVDLMRELERYGTVQIRNKRTSDPVQQAIKSA